MPPTPPPLPEAKPSYKPAQVRTFPDDIPAPPLLPLLGQPGDIPNPPPFPVAGNRIPGPPPPGIPKEKDIPTPPPPGIPGIPLPPPIKANSFMKTKRFAKDINWKSVTSACCSEDGSGGVAFVEFEIESGYPPVVVKGSSTVVQDLFASELATKLKIANPKYFTVSFTERWFSPLQTNIAKHAGNRAPKIKKELNRPFLMIMEKLKAKDIFQLIQSNQNASFSLSSFLNKERLVHIGKIMAMDVLLNNWDRLPLIWSNEGNLANLMFSQNSNTVYAIDQAVFPVTKAMLQNYEKYMAKVSDLVADMISPNWMAKENSPIYKVKQSFQLWTGYDMGDKGMFCLREGVLAGLCSILSSFSSKESLLEVKQKIKDIGRVDWQGVFHSGLRCVNLEFMFDIIHILKSNEEELCKSYQTAANAAVALEYGLLPYKTKQSGGNNKNFLKILTVQDSAFRHHSLRSFLQKEKDAGIQRTDLVLFYEYWFDAMISQKAIGEQTSFKPFLEIAADFNVFLCLGAACELVPKKGKQYCTSVLVGPDGYIGKYRKHRPISRGLDQGTEVGVWDTPVGRIAILICFDIENVDVFEESMQLQPDIIFNPVMIPSPHPQMATSLWNIGTDEMSHKFEAITRQRNCTIIRCDSDSGLGSSQTISPSSTTVTPNRNKSIFSSWIRKSRPEEKCEFLLFDVEHPGYGFESMCNPPERARTENRDNTGSRVLSRLIPQKTMTKDRHANFLHGDGSTLLSIFENHECSSTLSLIDTINTSIQGTLEIPYVVHATLPPTSTSSSLFSIANGRTIETFSPLLENVSRLDLPSELISFGKKCADFSVCSITGSLLLGIDIKANEISFRTNGTAGEEISLITGTSKPFEFLTTTANGILSLYDIRNAGTIISKHDSKISEVSGLECHGKNIFLLDNKGEISKISNPFGASPRFLSLPLPPVDEYRFTRMTSIQGDNGHPWILAGSQNGAIQVIDGNWDLLVSQTSFIQSTLKYHSHPLSQLVTNNNIIFSSDLSGAASSAWHYKKNRCFLPWTSAFRPHT